MRLQFQIQFHFLINYTFFTIVKGYRGKPSRHGPVGPPKRDPDKVRANDKKKKQIPEKN